MRKGIASILIAVLAAGCAATQSATRAGSAAVSAAGTAATSAASAATSVAVPAGKPLPKPGTPESVAVGREQYMKLCATCHGPSGTGDGIAASTFKRHPTDLTTLAQRNGGKFPTATVIDIVKGDTPISAHGKREMPVWGEILGRPLDTSMYQQDAADLKILSIAAYLQTIQK